MKKLATLLLALIAFGTFSLQAQDAADKEVVMGIVKEYASALNLTEEQNVEAMEILKEFVTKTKNIDQTADSAVSLEESTMELMKEANMRMKALLSEEQMELFSSKKGELKGRVMKYIQKELEQSNQSDQE